jgi:hypothetical protein
LTPVLVCAPAADALFMTRGTVFNCVCSQCSRRVMVAPTGQAFMKRNPSAVIVCFYCYRKGPEAKAPHAGWIGTDGTLSEDPSAVKNELRNIVPNKWRERN